MIRRCDLASVGNEKRSDTRDTRERKTRKRTTFSLFLAWIWSFEVADSFERLPRNLFCQHLPSTNVWAKWKIASSQNCCGFFVSFFCLEPHFQISSGRNKCCVCVEERPWARCEALKVNTSPANSIDNAKINAVLWLPNSSVRRCFFNLTPSDFTVRTGTRSDCQKCFFHF